MECQYHKGREMSPIFARASLCKSCGQSVSAPLLVGYACEHTFVGKNGLRECCDFTVSTLRVVEEPKTAPPIAAMLVTSVELTESTEPKLVADLIDEAIALPDAEIPAAQPPDAAN